MAITTALVTGLTPTTTGTASYTVSGFGNPQAAIIFISEASSGSNPAVNAAMGIGWTDGTTACSTAIMHEDTGATSDTYRYANQTTSPQRVITRISVTGAALVIGNFSSWTTDGITIDFTAVQATQYNIAIRLIKGCTTIQAGSTVMPSIATQTISSLSGKPNLIYFLCNGNVASTTIPANAMLSFGAAHNNSSNVVSQGQIAFGTMDAVADDLSNTVTRDDSCAGQLNNDAQAWRVAAANVTSVGFDLVPNVSPAGDTVFWMAMDTGDTDGVKVGIVDSPTATGTWSITSPGFQPQDVMLGITTTATTNTFLTSDPIGFGVGMFNSSIQAYAGIDTDDAAADMDTQSNFSSSKAVQLYHFGGTTHDIMHEGAFSSMDSTGYSLSFPTYVDATTRRWLSIAIKAPATGGSVSRSLSDTVVVSDTDTTTAERFRAILDAASAVDTVARLIQASRLRTDEATTTDAASRNLSSSRLLMDSASVYETLSASIQYAGRVVVSRILNDTITVEEALVRLARVTRQQADIVAVADAAMSSRELARRLVEDVLALDAQLRSVIRGRTVSEVLPVYDAAVRAVILVRLREELANVSDSLVASSTAATVVQAAINILMSVFTQEPIIMTIESEPIEMEVLL